MKLNAYLAEMSYWCHSDKDYIAPGIPENSFRRWRARAGKSEGLRDSGPEYARS